MVGKFPEEDSSPELELDPELEEKEWEEVDEEDV